MPYIVTTKRPDQYQGALRAEREAVSRCAVATMEINQLGEVLRPLLRHNLKALEWVDMMNALTSLPESGGTVGPLPDGTVIKVEPVDAVDLMRPLGRADFAPGPEELIAAAFNAREVSSDGEPTA